MPIFDIHTHIFPDSIAERTVEKVAAASGITPSYNGTRCGLLESMAAAGIDAALNCPIATDPKQVDSIISWASKNNQWPVFSLGSVHPDTENPEIALREVKAAGLAGIKLHPEYQEFTLEDPRLVPIWELCQEMRLLIMLHAGADVAFSPPYRSAPRAILDLLNKYPGLRLIAAHGGSWNMWDEVIDVLAGAPVWIDTSFVFGLMEDEKFMRLLSQHGDDKVLFGTDAPWRSQVEDARHFDQLPLTPEQRRAVLWDNAATLLDPVRKGIA